METITVPENSVGERLDKFVTSQLDGPSRSYVAMLINSKKILVNGEPKQTSYKIKQTDKIKVDFDTKSLDQSSDLEIPVIYEDADCIVLNKPEGVLTHSKGAYNLEETVSTFVQKRIAKDNDYKIAKTDPSVSNEVSREGIVHRLDRGTSGVIICAKNEKALKQMQKQFADRKVEKTYKAIIEGRMQNNEAIIDMPIDRNPNDPKKFRVAQKGKPAITKYSTISNDHNTNMTLLELTPKTGRTHQLRVHLAYFHHPIVGDVFYDGKPANRLMLHAEKLKLKLPSGKVKEFVAPMPKSFDNYLHNE